MSHFDADAPAWWPPKVGDKLRGVWGPDNEANNDPTYEVASVFEHDQCALIVTASWSAERKRWYYETHSATSAIVGSLRPDGAPRVKLVGRP